jgi:hypothetical protein
MQEEFVGGEALGISKAAYGYKGLEGAYEQNQCNILNEVSPN